MNKKGGIKITEKNLCEDCTVQNCPYKHHIKMMECVDYDNGKRQERDTSNL